MIATLKKLRLYYFTLRHLKPKQIFFQFYYRLRRMMRMDGINISAVPPTTTMLKLKDSIVSEQSFTKGTFTFLNLEKTFEEDIDWNFNGYGKLWAYNLNYFDYLNQREIETTTALSLIDSFCEQPKLRMEGCEPYPISLRGINWIKFFSKNGVLNTTYNAHLYGHYKFLSTHLEYHLLGNHLLENGFSLLFGAYYFKDENFYKKAERILQTELEEQILNDGGHFELSPMYHQILLFRLLDCINLIENNQWKGTPLLPFLVKTVSKMLGWLKTVSFNNGEVPMVNDAAYGIAPESSSLFDYANRLGVLFEESKLSDSGYRMVRSGPMEMCVDVGNIGPDYIPGHAHSDTLSFVMHVNNKPIIVDTATSTYDLNTQRIYERATLSHNTVVVNNTDQSQVWASFRVGRRAKITHLEEISGKISATHNGYEIYDILHQRSWQWSDRTLVIKDTLKGDHSSKSTAMAFFHFHPNCTVKQEGNIIVSDTLRLQPMGALSMELRSYPFAVGFNRIVNGEVLAVEFREQLETVVSY